MDRQQPQTCPGHINQGHLAKYLTWGKRLLTGELNFEFESKQEADDILADTEQSSLEFGLGGANKVSVEHAKWDDFSLSGKSEDLIYAKVPFTARGPLTISYRRKRMEK